MHWQKTGQDQQTSAVARYQCWFGPNHSDSPLINPCNFRPQFNFIGPG